jgi:hypothetical protein
VKIQNSNNAFVDIRKLREYVLDPEHRVGQHKARLFVALLSMKVDDAEALRTILLQIVTTHDSVAGKKDEFGQRYQIDFKLEWQGKEAMIRSAWNIRSDEDFPRLVTCYPLEE